jgi:hypothetical protein
MFCSNVGRPAPEMGNRPAPDVSILTSGLFLSTFVRRGSYGTPLASPVSVGRERLPETAGRSGLEQR